MSKAKQRKESAKKQRHKLCEEGYEDGLNHRSKRYRNHPQVRYYDNAYREGSKRYLFNQMFVFETE